MAADLLTDLRQFTDARIGLGRAGASLETRDWLELREAHAAARDAVEARIAWPAFSLPSVNVRSRAADRREYLLRPDLGRTLDPACELPPGPCDIVIIVGDGLSPLAVERHAPVVVGHLAINAPLILAENARVALSDEIGERMHARLAVMLIGERPGLSSADSLGIYMTYRPRIGRTDAERNCISNIRNGGLCPEYAARRASSLITEALRLGLTGVGLKEGGTLLT